MTRRVVSAIIVLAGVSLAGDVVCRSLARNGSQERLMSSASEAISRLPSSISNWRSEKSEPLSEKVLEMLECRSHQSRVYTDDTTGEKVNLILLVASAGPLLSHTPEVCYSSTAYNVIERATPLSIRGDGVEADVLNRVRFKSTSVDAHKLLVYYGWRRANGSWTAPENPRLILGGEPFLYKLQLAVHYPDGQSQVQDENSAGRRFLIDLLPVLDQICTTR